jgi:hypothetical protein
VAPAVNEGHFAYDGDPEDARDAFVGWLSEQFPEGQYQLLSFELSEDQQMELPLDIDRTKLN